MHFKTLLVLLSDTSILIPSWLHTITVVLLRLVALLLYHVVVVIHCHRLVLASMLILFTVGVHELLDVMHKPQTVCFPLHALEFLRVTDYIFQVS